MRFLKDIFIFVLVSGAIFVISYSLRPVVLAFDMGKFHHSIEGQAATGLFLFLNFPLMILARGVDIFRLDNYDVLVALGSNAIFFGMVIAGFLSIRKSMVVKKRRNKMIRRSIE
jgi:hypothetical protein